MKILITICGRGGSKGIPGKNIRMLNGKPLIGYSIAAAEKFAKGKDAVIALSTDSEQIRKTAEECGLKTDYKRAESLATDSAGKKEVIHDLVLHEEKKTGSQFDLVLDLDVTSPLRTIEDLEAGLKIFNEDPNALNLFSVNPANRNPYFNMVEQKEDGYYSLVKKGSFLTRQSSPAVYDMNASFYFYRRSYFDTADAVVTERSLVYIMPHICFDLDHPIDFEFLEFLVKNNKLGFEI